MPRSLAEVKGVNVLPRNYTVGLSAHELLSSQKHKLLLVWVD